MCGIHFAPLGHIGGWVERDVDQILCWVRLSCCASTFEITTKSRIQQAWLQIVGLTQPTIHRLSPLSRYSLFVLIMSINVDIAGIIFLLTHPDGLM